MDKDNEIELVQTIQEKDKKIKELEEKVKELEYMYESTKRELISRTNKYIELLEKLKDSVPKDKIKELFKKYNINISEEEITADGLDALSFIEEIDELLEEE